MNKRWVALDSIAVLLLTAVFMVLALGVTALSSALYSNTVQTASENNSSRTAIAYLSNQIRRCDHAEAIIVTRFEDLAAIKLVEYIDEDRYVTWLYCYDGYLRELFTEDTILLSVDAGIPILPLQSLSFQESTERLLQITIKDEQGLISQLQLAPRSGLIMEEV